MEIRLGKPYKRKGKLNAQWRLRFRYRLEDSDEWKTIDKYFTSYAECQKNRPKIEQEIRRTQGGFKKGSSMTFNQLADYALETYYAPATIKRGVKISGIKSVSSVMRHLAPLRMYFGKKKIGGITGGDLRSYRKWRNRLGSRRGVKGGSLGAEISETTINRELQTLRRMFRDAHSEGWISRDIFVGAKVILTSHEKQRSRILSESEEKVLLDACSDNREIVDSRGRRRTTAVHNEYLRCLILMGCDTGMRKGEILKLSWEDIDFIEGTIQIVAANSKTEKERKVPISARVEAELRSLPTFNKTGKVFPFAEFKRSWETAKRLAGIEDLHFHDLRSTTITRLIDVGVPLPEVAKIAGHETHTTTVKHYVSINGEITKKIGDIINLANQNRANLWAAMDSGGSDVGSQDIVNSTAIN